MEKQLKLTLWEFWCIRNTHPLEILFSLPLGIHSRASRWCFWVWQICLGSWNSWFFQYLFGPVNRVSVKFNTWNTKHTWYQYFSCVIKNRAVWFWAFVLRLIKFSGVWADQSNPEISRRVQVAWSNRASFVENLLLAALWVEPELKSHVPITINVGDVSREF